MHISFLIDLEAAAESGSGENIFLACIFLLAGSSHGRGRALVFFPLLISQFQGIRANDSI